jgi:hypothetical protein
MNKVFDICFLRDFFEAEKIWKYKELCEFFKKFNEEFYNKLNIYYEAHHIVPKCEGGKYLQDNIIFVPIYYHFKLHILRAKEAKSKSAKYKNYAAAWLIAHQNKTNYSLNFLLDNPEIVCEVKRNNYGNASYDKKYGKEKSKEIRKKLSEKARIKNFNESKETREKRRISLKKYARNRPQIHNDNISINRKNSSKCHKKIICLNDMKIYERKEDCNYQVSISSIIYCCQNKFQQVKGLFFQYYNDESISYWEKIYDLKKEKLRPKGWSSYNNSKMLS